MLFRELLVALIFVFAADIHEVILFIRVRVIHPRGSNPAFDLVRDHSIKRCYLGRRRGTVTTKTCSGEKRFRVLSGVIAQPYKPAIAISASARIGNLEDLFLFIVVLIG